MAAFTSFDPGTPCWVDFMSSNVDASKEFYGAVFGWDAEDQFAPGGERVYTMFRRNGQKVAGLLGKQDPNMPSVWTTYIATADVGKTAELVTANGGTVMMPPLQVSEAGEMAIFIDPAGAVFGVWRGDEHVGADVCNEPDTYSWNELLSRDIDAALPFYSAVFGWTYDPVDMGDSIYNVIVGGENGGLGGLMAMPPQVPGEVPSHWAVYFAVADIDATIEKIKANGGQAMPVMPIPGIGKMAPVFDPDGGAFSVLQPESAS